MATPTSDGVVSPVYETGWNYIDSILDYYKWGGELGTGANLTYSIRSNDSYYDYDEYYYAALEPWNAWYLFTPAQVTGINAALNAWAKVANLNFTQVTDSESVAGDLRFSTDTQQPTSAAYLPWPSSIAGDVWFGTAESLWYPNPGGYAYATYLHEIGHALGLDHPHSGVIADLSIDFVAYTIMSYRDYAGDSVTDGLGSSFLPTTPMLNDIAAIQYLYGANMSTNSGDTTYSWGYGASVYETIWDGGGNDTISWANQFTSADIDLNAGSWSTLGPYRFAEDFYAFENLAIAYGVTIENAIGGGAGDEITGNGASNVLIGNGGGDYIYGGDGDDTIFGNLDLDQLYGNLGNDLIYGGQGRDFIFGGVGLDLITGGADDDELNGGSGNDTLLGLDGNDVIYGILDNDSIDGGAGDDLVFGGQGNENIIGGLGKDTLHGGSENDTITGDDGADSLVGALGDDSVLGGFGNDTITGDDGNDLLFGNQDNDRLDGGAGADQLFGGVGLDYMLGGAGGDELTGGSGNDTLIGNTDNDVLYGNQDDDRFDGGIGDDQLFGGTGFDLMLGGAGNDTAHGGSENDTIVGGAGNDSMVGGAGNDVFRYDATVPGSADVTANGHDIVDVTAGDFISMLGLIEELKLTGAFLQNLSGNVQLGGVINASNSVAYTPGVLKIDLNGNGSFLATEDFQISLTGVISVTYFAADDLFHLA